MPFEDLSQTLMFWERAVLSAKTSPPFPLLKIKKMGAYPKAHLIR